MIHLITYGDDKFKKSKKRLEKEALNTGWFDSVTVYGPEILDDDFKEKFKHILVHTRIAGYGIWRPYIIKKKLNEINDDDILIYLDAGCSINHKGKNRFYEYIDMLNNSNEDIISFKMSHLPEKHWTTKEIFNYFNVDINSEIANSGQILDGILIMKKNKNLINKNQMWYDVIYKNALLFTDYYNNLQEPYFKANRHEQSIFSIIRKLHKSIELEDETFFWNPWDTRNAENYPFLATRIRN